MLRLSLSHSALPALSLCTPQLNLSRNLLCGLDPRGRGTYTAEGITALADALKNNNIMKELNIASNNLGKNSSWNNDMSGIIAICDVIPTMGALTSLNLASNHLKAQGAKHIAKAIKANVSGFD